MQGGGVYGAKGLRRGFSYEAHRGQGQSIGDRVANEFPARNTYQVLNELRDLVAVFWDFDASHGRGCGHQGRGPTVFDPHCHGLRYVPWAFGRSPGLH